MTIHRYDTDDRLRQLGALPERARVVFALLCATRLLPCYRRFHDKTKRGDAQAVEDLAARLWRHAAEPTMSPAELERSIDQCMALIPSADDEWDEQTQPYAEDAAAALAYALRTALTGAPQEAEWAGTRADASMDQFAIDEMGADAYDVEAQLRHPAVQRELGRQVRDLIDLAEAAGTLDRTIVARLRRRAVHDSADVLLGQAVQSGLNAHF